VPPENKPTGAEIKNCQPFFQKTIADMLNLKVMLALGKIAHDTIIRTFGYKLAAYKFAHRAKHDLGDGLGGGLIMIDSYHCSRYNTQTGRLTERMFHDVFDDIQSITAKD
jgi:uracil-DNA glycosylase